jgi:hypothetical protein
VTDLTKAKLIYLLLLAALFAYFLACMGRGWGMADGGGFH